MAEEPYCAASETAVDRDAIVAELKQRAARIALCACIDGCHSMLRPARDAYSICSSQGTWHRYHACTACTTACKTMQKSGCS